MISFFVCYGQDERVQWRGARALRELILKDEANKQLCYQSTIKVIVLTADKALFSTIPDKFEHHHIHGYVG